MKSLENLGHYRITVPNAFACNIDAKLFIHHPGDKALFRVYRVYGDVTRLDLLKQAILNLLQEHNAPECDITVNL